MCVHEEMKTNSDKKRSNGSSNMSDVRRAIPRSESNFSMSAHSNAPVYQVTLTHNFDLGSVLK